MNGLDARQSFEARPEAEVDRIRRIVGDILVDCYSDSFPRRYLPTDRGRKLDMSHKTRP